MATAEWAGGAFPEHGKQCFTPTSLDRPFDSHRGIIVEVSRMSLLSKLLYRAVVGAALLAVLFGSAYIGGWAWFACVSALTLIALNEYYSALRHAKIRADRYLGSLCALMALLLTQVGESIRLLAGPADTALEYGGIGVLATAHVLQLTLLVLLLCVAGTLVSQFKLHGEGSAVANSATTVFGLVYVGLLMTFLIRARYVDIPQLVGNEGASIFLHRLGALLLIIVSIWACDTAAFIVGNLVGRHKLAPTVSPNKTIEGSVAGLIAAIGGSLLVGLTLGLPAYDSLVLGAVMGVLGQVGDLGKSVLKRDLDIKDFSSLFGPHGGVLDRFDAVLVSLPLLYWYFWFFWLHPV